VKGRMMNASRDDRGNLRQALQAAGLWRDFCDRVVEVQQGTGLPSGEAWRQVELEFADRLRRPGANSDLPSESNSRGVARANAEGPVNNVGEPEPVITLLYEDYFGDALWVYDSLRRESVSPADASTFFARWLLEECRKDPQVLREPLLIFADFVHGLGPNVSEEELLRASKQAEEKMRRHAFRAKVDRLGLK
jgi:hypothetical protein